MNDRAREVLVAAALNNVRQIRWEERDKDGGRCAIGVLVDAANGCSLATIFDVSREDWGNIVYANDKLGWDFLTIARKIGVKEGA